jgi:hypothetical protein
MRKFQIKLYSPSKQVDTIPMYTLNEKFNVTVAEPVRLLCGWSILCRVGNGCLYVNKTEKEIEVILACSDDYDYNGIIEFLVDYYKPNNNYFTELI